MVMIMIYAVFQKCTPSITLNYNDVLFHIITPVCLLVRNGFLSIPTPTDT